MLERVDEYEEAERGGWLWGKDRTSDKEARDHYGNILRTEEVIFKEIRLPFQGNFAFPRAFSFSFFGGLSLPHFLPQQDDYENFAPFSGFSQVSFVWLGHPFT